jgi:hypothetical protein
LNPENIKEEILIDNTIKVNKFLIYFTVGLVLILLITSTFLLVSRRRNDKINS